MNKVKQAVKNFWNDESGVTAVEYILIVGLMTIAIVAGWATLSGAISTAFTNVVAAISGSGG